MIRDASNQIRHRIALTPGNIGTWIDLTEHVRTAGQGIVEAEFFDTAGNGQWKGKLSVRTRSPSNPVEDVERGKQRYIDPSALFCNKA